jgi:FkbM family methyltransferase
MPSRPPLLFLLSRTLTRRGARGGYRLLHLARRLGQLDRVVRYPIPGGGSLDVPISRPENAWDRRDVLSYQHELIDDLVRVVEAARGTATLLDCGADIGLISVRVAARCSDRLGEVVAIEPNPVAQDVLEANLSRVPVPSRVVRAAAASFSGRGSLSSPAYDDSDHARFLVEREDGPIAVVRIDDLGLREGVPLVVKLDVEGGELDVLRGAERTLRSAAGFAVSFEAHPAVAERTGIDPMEIVRFLDTIRACDVTISEFPALALDPQTPFFSQFSAPRMIGYSVLCRSR